MPAAAGAIRCMAVPRCGLRNMSGSRTSTHSLSSGIVSRVCWDTSDLSVDVQVLAELEAGPWRFAAYPMGGTGLDAAPSIDPQAGRVCSIAYSRGYCSFQSTCQRRPLAPISCVMSVAERRLPLCCVTVSRVYTMPAPQAAVINQFLTCLTALTGIYCKL